MNALRLKQNTLSHCRTQNNELNSVEHEENRFGDIPRGVCLYERNV